MRRCLGKAVSRRVFVSAILSETRPRLRASSHKVSGDRMAAVGGDVAAIDWGGEGIDDSDSKDRALSQVIGTHAINGLVESACFPMAHPGC